MKIGRLLRVEVITLTLLHIITLLGHAAPRPPLPPLPELVRVAYAERFNTEYTNGATTAVLEVAGVGRLVESWSGYALQRSGAVPPYVIPGVVNGYTNIRDYIFHKPNRVTVFEWVFHSDFKRGGQQPRAWF